MPGIVLIILHMFTRSILPITLGDHHYWALCFTDEEIESQRSSITCLRQHSYTVRSQEILQEEKLRHRKLKKDVLNIS